MVSKMLALVSALVLAAAPVRARLGESLPAVDAAVAPNVTIAAINKTLLGGGVRSAVGHVDEAEAQAHLEEVSSNSSASAFGVPIDAESFRRGGAARSSEFWSNASLLTTAFAVEQGGFEMYGHEYLATTTHYENTCCASCGSVDTGALVAGTDYYAVASAQAMQNYFPETGGDCCWCGKASRSCGHGTGTAPMGCTECAVGRFIRKRPYSQSLDGSHPIFSRTFNLVVADICPHKGNEAWCPPHPGHKNTFGSKNHFDFADPPAGFDNYYFAFTPAPCSAEIQRRMRSQSRCR